jgi:hypothetical protein
VVVDFVGANVTTAAAAAGSSGVGAAIGKSLTCLAPTVCSCRCQLS